MINLHFLHLRTVVLSIIMVVLLSTSVWAVNFIWFKPLQPAFFYERVVIERVLEDPELMSELGFIDGWGMFFFKDELTNESLDQRPQRIQDLQNDLITLASYKKDELGREEWVNQQILEWHLRNELREEQFLFYKYPLNHLMGAHHQTALFLASSHPIQNKSDVDSYLRRLKKVPKKFNQIVEVLKVQRQQELLPPYYSLMQTRDQLLKLINTPATEHVLYQSFAVKLAELDLNKDYRQQLQDKVAVIIDDTIKPGYQRLLQFTEESLHEAPNAVSLAAKEQGRAYYTQLLQRYGSLRLSPQEVLQIGQSEVVRLQQEMAALLDSVHPNPEDVGREMRLLGLKDESIYSDNVEGYRQALYDVEAMVQEAETAFDSLFRSNPQHTVEVELMAAQQKRIPKALLYRPRAKGAEAATAIVDVAAIQSVPKYGYRSMVYQKAIPGQHYLEEYIRKDAEVPTFRKLLSTPAFREGWSLYAQDLAHEQGLYSTHLEELGRLQIELTHAARLVADVNIHWNGWTRDQATTYLTKATGIARPQAEQMTDRMAIYPGRSVAATLGLSTFRTLRNRAEAHLGSDFDIREFHHQLLKNGPMPLSVLKTIINDWIEAEKNETLNPRQLAMTQDQ